MTENTHNELAGNLFARIQHIVNKRGVDIQQNLKGHALHLVFADGQRILINVDPSNNNVWLATRNGGIEFFLQGGEWRTTDKTELLAHLENTIELTIHSHPLNTRTPDQVIKPVVAQAHIETAPTPTSHWLRNSLVVVLAGLIGFWGALRLLQPQDRQSIQTQSQVPSQTLSQSQTNTPSQCESAFPENGKISLFPDSSLHTDIAGDPEITLNNNHAHPLLLIIATPNTLKPLASVMLHARQSSHLHLPIGQYDILFSSGTTWCNAYDGFAGGNMLKFNQAIIVQAGKPMQLAMQSSGASTYDFQLFVKTIEPQEATPPPPTFTGDGSMEVQRHANGHFYLPGTIANAPVTFMVDTGASITTVSSDIARQAGVHNCKEVQFQTANGTAIGCVALVPKMTIGNFSLENITIAVLPNLETNLLGANVLRNFQVSQSDSMMLLGRK
ncbi:MAG: iron donor protein CyaY [Sideroxydans sp.]|nr:iron donor protein CyaY [Sideroxydans sp.]